MALVNAGRILYPDFRANGWTSVSGSTSFQINGSGQKLGWVFPVPATGTITKIGVRVNGAATPATTRVGLYTVDSSGLPTTSAYGSSVYGTFTPAASTYAEITLGTPATATLGDLAAIVVEWDSTAGDISWAATGGTTFPVSLPYPLKHNGTSWSKTTNGASLGGHVFYSDVDGGSWPDIGLVPFSGLVTNTLYTTLTDPDEYALKFALPFKCRAAGIWTGFYGGSGSDYVATLYSGTTSLASKSMDGDAAHTNGSAIKVVLFDTPVTLNAGSTYRAGIAAGSTTNVSARSWPLYAAGVEQSIGLPQGTHQSTRVDAGSWTDQTTTLPLIGLVIDRLGDDAGGTAGGLTAGLQNIESGVIA